MKYETVLPLFMTEIELPSLPIFDVADEVKGALMDGPANLAAPPGSGETTVVPLLLLDEPWLNFRGQYM